MKHILTIISCFAVLSMSAQTDYPFPWNPDADLDGWVSTEDLLQLLTVFGTQFEPDTWETDSISAAVVLDGNHNYFQWQSYCNDIEGNWRMADLDAFGRHFDLASSVSAYFWVNGNDKLNSSDFAYDTYQLYGPTGDMTNVSVSNFSQAKKCMCYIQSSPFVPSQFTEDSNLALWSSVSDLQEQVDSLQTALNSLQSSSAVVDSISSPSSQFSFECVDMGVNPLCSEGSGISGSLESEDNYSYYLSHSGSAEVTNDVVAPMWRKFCISGLFTEETTVGIHLTSWQVADYSGSNNDWAGITVDSGDLVVQDGVGCFYVSAGGPCNEGGDWEDVFGNDAFFNVYNYSSTMYGWNSRQHFSVSLEKDGSYMDTGIRFHITGNYY